MLIDMRLPTPEVGEAAIERVSNLRPFDPDFRIEISGGPNRAPYEKSPGIAALFEHARGLAAKIGFELEDLMTGGGSDGNVTAPLAPTLDGLGVDGKGATPTSSNSTSRRWSPAPPCCAACSRP